MSKLKNFVVVTKHSPNCTGFYEVKAKNKTNALKRAKNKIKKDFTKIIKEQTKNTSVMTKDEWDARK